VQQQQQAPITVPQLQQPQSSLVIEEPIPQQQQEAVIKNRNNTTSSTTNSDEQKQQQLKQQQLLQEEQAHAQAMEEEAREIQAELRRLEVEQQRLIEQYKQQELQEQQNTGHTNIVISDVSDDMLSPTERAIFDQYNVEVQCKIADKIHEKQPQKHQPLVQVQQQQPAPNDKPADMNDYEMVDEQPNDDTNGSNDMVHDMNEYVLDEEEENKAPVQAIVTMTEQDMKNEQQLEADLKLALELQREYDEEHNKILKEFAEAEQLKKQQQQQQRQMEQQRRIARQQQLQKQRQHQQQLQLQQQQQQEAAAAQQQQRQQQQQNQQAARIKQQQQHQQQQLIQQHQQQAIVKNVHAQPYNIVAMQNSNNNVIAEPPSHNRNRKLLFLVVDTNILISFSKFVQDLAEYGVQQKAAPQIFIVIPGIVLRELDGLKNDSKQVGRMARIWIRYILQRMQQDTNNNRIILQEQNETVEFALLDKRMKVNADDMIWNCALYYTRNISKVMKQRSIAMANNSKITVALLTNDNGLAINSIRNHVKTIVMQTIKDNPMGAIMQHLQ